MNILDRDWELFLSSYYYDYAQDMLSKYGLENRPMSWDQCATIAEMGEPIVLPEMLCSL